MSQVVFSHKSETGIPPEDLKLAQAIADVLCKHYPGWPWAITADHRDGVATIKNHMLHPKWGYLFKIGEADTPRDLYRAVVNAGGELLERFGVPRGPMTDEAVASIKNADDVMAEAYSDERQRRRMDLVV